MRYTSEPDSTGSVLDVSDLPNANRVHIGIEGEDGNTEAVLVTRPEALRIADAIRKAAGA